MRVLATLDYAVIVAYLLVIFFAGMLLTRRAGTSMAHFFVGGRQMSWWLIGVSMAATNFSIDTPIAITKLVRTEGVAGVWFFWASAISGLLTAFLFARLWRRSGVMTDAEIIEVRYGGKSAAALRVFKGFYFGLLFNAFIMGWVFLALMKVLTGLTDLDTSTILIVTTILVFVYTLASGFYGVVLTDFVQYFFALAGSILLAVFAVGEVGGLKAMATQLAELAPPDQVAFMPELSTDNMGPLSMFFTFILVQWWAHKYADGGGKHIQRMLSAKDEDHAFYASFFYSFINYALQVWPWILTALCSLILFGDLADPETAYAATMGRVLPVGLMGLVLAGLIGAFMSTIDTHLNLGASYLVNDMYRRFLVKDAPERHYVVVSRLAMALLLVVAVIIALNMSSVASAWKFLLTFASGAGLTWIARWFWWRVNAWSEFSAMIASGMAASFLHLSYPDWLYSWKLCVTVGFTTLVWVPVTLLTAPVPQAKLIEFVGKIRPGSWGWRPIYEAENLDVDPFLKKALGHWLLALTALFCLNFGLGAWLLSRTRLAAFLLSLGFLAALALWRTLRAQQNASALHTHK